MCTGYMDLVSVFSILELSRSDLHSIIIMAKRIHDNDITAISIESFLLKKKAISYLLCILSFFFGKI